MNEGVVSFQFRIGSPLYMDVKQGFGRVNVVLNRWRINVPDSRLRVVMEP